jgi:hypothetical protein
MAAYLTPEIIMFVLGLLSVMFSIYHYFKNPQTQLEKQQEVNEKEADGKAALLAQQLEWSKEENNRRFNDMNLALTGAMSIAQNHIHTIDVKQDALKDMVNTMNLQLSNELTKLRTTIEERIPPK